MDPYVIVGAGLAGAKAAETLRAEGFDGPVVLIGDEDELPYERPPLSKGYLLGKDPREGVRRPPGRVVRRARRRPAAGHSRSARSTRPSTRSSCAGGERLRYDKLLLATGSLVRPLDVPGRTDRGALPAHAARRRRAQGRAAAPAAGVVVVGGGWIGLEVAAAAREHGAEVTRGRGGLACRCARVLGDEVGRGLRRPAPRARGRRPASTPGVKRDDGADGPSPASLLDDGTGCRPTWSLVGVGIRPDTRLAAEAGLAGRRRRPRRRLAAHLRRGHLRGRRRGQRGQPAARPPVRVEHWANALNGGPAAAKSMLGQEVTYDRVPYFFSDQYDLGMEYSGWAPPGSYDRVVVRGDLDARPRSSSRSGCPAGGCWPA